MFKIIRGVFSVIGLLVLGTVANYAQDDAMSENPKYKFWSGFKPGASSTYIQTTKLGGPEKLSVPGGVETKTITYRLLNTNKDKAVVVTTVVEEDFLSTVESAPTKITFPAQVKSANLKAFLQEWSAKDADDEVVKVGGREIKCKVKAGAQKVEGGSIEFKLYYSASVPGGIVKHLRTTRDGDMTVAETTTTLVSFAEGKVGKTQDKK